MTELDLVIKGRVLIGNEMQTICIGIEDGKITVLGKDLDGDKFLDYSKYLIMPGGIDIHTHMRDPGFTDKEDFHTGTMAAAFGGTTTIMDMPNTRPMVTNVSQLKDKLDIIGKKANVDYGLYASLTPDSDIKVLKELAVGFKLFMAETTSAVPISEEDIRNKLADPELEGQVVSVHAESPERFRDIEVTSLDTHDDSRPASAEIIAVENITQMKTSAIMHFAHLTDLMSFEKAFGYSNEITPHHMFLSTSSDLGARGRVNPPLRNIREQASLFTAFVKAQVGIIASDHAPHTMDEKKMPFGEAPSGLPGVETRLPMMLALVQSEQVSLRLVQATCCHNPARLFSLSKGQIDVGFDADLSIFDMTKNTKIKGERLHSKCGWTPFEDYNAIFPDHVFLRGRKIISDGKLIESGTGRNIV